MKLIRSGLVLVAMVGLLVLVARGGGDGGRAAAALADAVEMFVQGCLGVMLLVVGSIILYFFRRQHFEAARQRDGAWPLRKVVLVPTWVRLVYFFRGQMAPCVVVDQNLLVGGVIVLTSEGIYQPEPNCGWDRQLEFSVRVQDVNSTRAAVPGDGVAALPWYRPARGPVARLPVVRGALQAPTVDVAPTAAPAAAYYPSLVQLLDSSQRLEIACGYRPDGTVGRWLPLEQPHLRVHGGTQTGKTSWTMGLAALLVALDWQVVVLDRRGFKDWRVLDGRAELVDTRSSDGFVMALQAVRAEYERRECLLRNYGVHNIEELSHDVRPAQLAVVLEEYGAARVAAREMRQVIDEHLSIVVSEAAVNGIHVVAVDQRPVAYDPAVKANCGPVVFGLPEGAGGSAGYFRAHKLPQRSFYFDGQVWNSVHARPDIAMVLANRGTKYSAVVGGGVREGVREGVQGAVHEGVRGSLPEVDTHSPVVTNVPKTRGEWYTWVVEYISAGHYGLLQDPPTGVREMASAMAEFSGRGTDHNYAGLASGLAKEIRESARLGNGAPLGMDITVDGTWTS